MGDKGLGGKGVLIGWDGMGFEWVRRLGCLKACGGQGEYVERDRT